MCHSKGETRMTEANLAWFAGGLFVPEYLRDVRLYRRGGSIAPIAVYSRSDYISTDSSPNPAAISIVAIFCPMNGSIRPLNTRSIRSCNAGSIG